MSSGFQPKDQEVLTRAIKVQRLVIPFIINHNAVPASKGIGSDESSVLFLETQGDSQLVPDPPTPMPGLPVLGAASGFSLGASAAITNTGSSVINGDVSLSPAGSITPGAWRVNGFF